MSIGRVFGIPLRLHWSLVLVLPFVLLVSARAADPGHAAAQLTMLFGVVFLSVLAHELGHALVARRLDVGVHSILIGPFMGATRMEVSAEPDPGREIYITLAGPFVNLLIAALVLPVAVLTFAPLEGGGYVLGRHGFATMVVEINVLLGLFNLLPAFPMDGGIVLRAALSRKIGRMGATELAAGIGSVFAFAFVVYGILAGGVFWVFAGIWLWWMGQQERSRTYMLEQLRARGAAGIPPELVMLMDMLGIPPGKMREALRSGNPFGAVPPGSIRDAPGAPPPQASARAPHGQGPPNPVQIDLSDILFGPGAHTPMPPPGFDRDSQSAAPRKVEVEVVRVETNPTRPPASPTSAGDTTDEPEPDDDSIDHHRTRDGRHFYKGQELL